ncbi:MAG: HlyD family efflux transporter periplasmic adaptor subunit [Rhizobiales bacterium]|nr:HlyD family efflux transporter periplasmic adaptor subunit [Hyphomicrobiales bacterium]
MRHADFAFANDIRTAAALKTPRTSRLLLLATITMLVCGGIWAHYAVLDEVKRGAGRVIPSRQMQVVQSLEGGIIRTIFVQEGDTVKEGQPLVQIDDTKFRSDLGELRAKRDAIAASLKLLNREVELTSNLYKQKVVPEIEMLRLQRQAADVSGQLAVIEETIKSARDRVQRTELKAPAYGIVNKINVTTIGAVVQPGAEIMDIVPLDDTLLVEGRIRPQDIAFIRPGQSAVVKITAYESTVYGSLKAKVERISADTIEEKADKNDKPQTFYRVIVRTDRNYLGTQQHPLPIIPGMIATVEVLTGHKTVLDYLIKPARLLRDEALRER